MAQNSKTKTPRPAWKRAKNAAGALRNKLSRARRFTRHSLRNAEKVKDGTANAMIRKHAKRKGIVV